MNTIHRFAISLVLLVPAVVEGQAQTQDDVRASVVKILATRRGPDLFRPWTKQSPQEVSGSGAVIDGKRILTNAHVVRYASQVYVQGFQSADKVAAKVVALATGIDLAILTLEDDAFFAARPPLPMADQLPAIKDTVNVYGYPVGGTEMSVTQGIVSRIEFSGYYQETSGLRIQVDAALNPGNSGGPAAAKGRMVGLVFSRIQESDNIGYLIPIEEIKMFLADVEKGKTDSKPQWLEGCQTVENEALRAKLGLAKGVGGSMVEEPYLDDKSYPLKEWDVITRIGDRQIESDGKVRVQEDLRLFFPYLLPKLALNGKINLTVLRDGKEMKVDLPVRSERDGVVRYLRNNYPRYFVYGPLVFSPATHDFIAGLGEKGQTWLQFRRSPLLCRQFRLASFEGEELVIVASRMFPHKITKSYSDPFTSVVSHVNGAPVKNLRHMVEMLRAATGPYIIFKFADKGAETLVFRRDEIMAATEEILTDNGIRAQYSDDLKDAWEKGKAKD